MTNPDLFTFIDAQRLAVLATVSPTGAPQSALVGFAVTPNLELIFDTLDSTRKYANLTADPLAAFVIGAGEITIQYEGIAEQPLGASLARAKEIYFRKWPECLAHQTWPGIAYFLVHPRWIRYSDYDRNPPYIVERNLESG